jgi:hypothetical protein
MKWYCCAVCDNAGGSRICPECGSQAREICLACEEWIEDCTCWHCGAEDSRGPDHQRGCPKLPRLTKAELLALADEVARGWRSRVRRDSAR